MGVMPPRKGKGITIDTKRNVLLVDGNALYKTGYHGAKDEFNAKGEHIGGIYQFITMVRKMLMDNLYHQVYVFWDGELSGKLRYNFYSDYKIGRGKDFINGTRPEDDKDQIIERAIVQEYLEELYVRQLEHPIVEADDFIAYYCKTRKEVENITIISNDRDLCQLIDDNVKMYLCDRKIYVEKYTYQNFFLPKRENLVLMKVIAGDTSDSIKGVKGVKEKTLLNHFPELKKEVLTLEDIISKAKIIQEERAKVKKKPLKAIDNIIYGISDGVQGDQLYEINHRLVDLTIPLLTEDAEKQIINLMDSPLSIEDRSIKNAYLLMKRDGIDRLIQNYTIDYLLPFKKLVEREKKHKQQER